MKEIKECFSEVITGVDGVSISSSIPLALLLLLLLSSSLLLNDVALADKTGEPLDNVT